MNLAPFILSCICLKFVLTWNLRLMQLKWDIWSVALFAFWSVCFLLKFYFWLFLSWIFLILWQLIQHDIKVLFRQFICVRIFFAHIDVMNFWRFRFTILVLLLTSSVLFIWIISVIKFVLLNIEGQKFMSEMEISGIRVPITNNKVNTSYF
jgi:hypothetical protein